MTQEKIKEEIISVIQKNRISSVEVADALGKQGVINGPKPLTPGKFIVGEVQYIFGYSESNWPIHEQGHHVKEGGILFVDTVGCNDKAAFGDLVAKYFILYKNMEGLVVNGLLRDVHTLKKESYPIWCTGVTPLGCFNRPVELTAEIKAHTDKQRELIEGSIMVCDDSGCTIIEKRLLNEDTKKKLEFVELQEDIWYYCIDTLKWSTYETVCLKNYLKYPDVLPKTLRDQLSNIDLEKK